MIRDWHVQGQLTVLPATATVLLHGLILAFMLLRWQSDAELRTIEARVLPPAIINATLIDADSLKRKVEKKAAPAPRKSTPQKSTPKPARRTASSSAATTKSAPAASKAPPKAAPKQSAPAPKPAEPEERRISAEELAAISRRELAASVAAEDSARVAVTAEQMSASYAALIRDTVTGYWSRPPSARNGMQAVLELQLIPTGEIVSVRVLESSGSVAFDRSAMNAVDKAGAFSELKNLPSREFEENFRRFRLLFRPEDLRY